MFQRQKLSNEIQHTQVSTSKSQLSTSYWRPNLSCTVQPNNYEVLSTHKCHVGQYGDTRHKTHRFFESDPQINSMHYYIQTFIEGAMVFISGKLFQQSYFHSRIQRVILRQETVQCALSHKRQGSGCGRSSSHSVVVLVAVAGPAGVVGVVTVVGGQQYWQWQEW